MKTYKQIDLDNIQTSETHEDGSFTSGIIRRNEIRLDAEGVEYSPWDDLIESGVEIIDDTLTSAKSEALALVNSQRDAAIAGGVLYDGYTYQSDSQSIADLNAVSTLSLINPAINVPWLTLDNTVVVLNATQIQELAGLFATHKTQHVITARTNKDLINAATSIEEIQSIV